MAITIFFGGILLGFLIGFSCMALLSVMNYHLFRQELQELPAYQSQDQEE
jgi:nucleoside recognition membrane protein YjiH